MFERHYAGHVRIQQEGGDFRIYYQHNFPRGVVEEERDPRRFNSLEEAEQFAEECAEPIVFLQRWIRAATKAHDGSTVVGNSHQLAQ